MPAKTIVVFNSKGGVGKTSTGANVGAYFAASGLRTLLVDCDCPQASLTGFYEIPEGGYGEGGIVELIANPDVDPGRCITRTSVPDLDLVVGNDVGKSLSTWVRGSASRTYALRQALKPLAEEYDLIIVDTQGADGSGDLQELALRAADMILMPLVPNAIDVREFVHNSMELLQRLAPLDPEDTANRLPSPHVLIYRYKPNTRTHDEWRANIRDLVSRYESTGRARLLAVEIPESVRYNDAQAEDPRLPIHVFDPARRSAKQVIPSGAESMHDLATEIAGHFGLFLPHPVFDESQRVRTSGAEVPAAAVEASTP